MSLRMAAAAGPLLGAWLFAQAPPVGSASMASTRAFLSTHFRLGDSDFRTLERRGSVVRSLDTADGREVATLGVVRMRVPPGFYADRLRDVVAFKKQADAVLQIGAFTSPARTADISGLSLDDGDIDDLRKCRPRDCGVQLSADAFGRMRAVSWGTARTAAAANETMREILVDLVNRYRAEGDTALMAYVDGSRPLTVVIVSVTHLAIAPLRELPDGFAAASKQIYGSHYFDASLGITIVLGAGSDADAGSFLVYVNRSRVDALSGFFGGVKRALVRSRTRGAMGDSLISARDAVENQFRAGVGTP